MGENFHEYTLREAKAGNPDAQRIVSQSAKGENLIATALRIARNEVEKGRYPQIVADKLEEKGMIDGSFDLTYEGASRIYNRIDSLMRSSGDKKYEEYAKMFQSFDPETDHDLIATGLFALIPEIREYVGGSFDSLYKIVLTSGSKNKLGYKLPSKFQRDPTFSNEYISNGLSSFISSIPPSQTSEEKENQRRLNVLIDKKVERESFHLFKYQPEEALENLNRTIAQTENENLRDAFIRLRNTYQAYLDVKPIGVNPKFRDPSTGKLGTLPSIHQLAGMYHILQEKKFGIFDGCGTGKTAQATLAQPLIQERLGKGFDRTIIVCPNHAKMPWRLGLAGDETQRYLEEIQDVIVINREVKDSTFMKRLENAKWIIMNYDQLQTEMKGSNTLFLDELRQLGSSYVILDEAHHIKGQRKTTRGGKPTISAATQLLAHNVEYLSILTATPIPNTLDDYGVLAHLLQPDVFESPEVLRDKIQNSPRVLYTFFNQKTIRRTAEEINEDLDHDENEVLLNGTSLQRKLYDHIVEFRPANWMMQARKALLDPRLVDPEILKQAGVFGKISRRSSSKYKALEDLLVDESGPLQNNEKFVVFSTMFKQGVTQETHPDLEKRYAELGLDDEYRKLGLHTSLQKDLESRLSKTLRRKVNIGYIDGSIEKVSDREAIVEQLGKTLDGLVVTTDSAGESLNMTAANHVFYLDEDYNPTTEEQATPRVLRNGQTKKVHVSKLRIKESLDTELRDYVEKKRILIKTAQDGHPLTKEELDLLYDEKGEILGHRLKAITGGKSINTYEAELIGIDDITSKRRIKGKRKGGPSREIIFYNTTKAQELNRQIADDPINCWKRPDFIKAYMEVLPNIAPPVMQRAKVLDLVRRVKDGQLSLPRSILSEGSGPSLLYDAYMKLENVLAYEGLKIPRIVDRDFSQGMLDEGNNPNQILGDMTGKDSTIKAHSFDMVDNESLTLLRNHDEIKESILEAHRVLRPNGLIELLVKNWKFDKNFYSGMESLGFEVLTEKNEGLYVSSEAFKRLREIHGAHFANSFRSKLNETHFLIGRKVAEPASVSSKNFQLVKMVEEDPVISDPIIHIQPQSETFVGNKRIIRDSRSGLVESVEDF